MHGKALNVIDQYLQAGDRNVQPGLHPHPPTTANQPALQPKAQWCNPQKSRASGDLIYAHNYEHQSNPLLTTLKGGKVKLHSVPSHALPLPGWKKERSSSPFSRDGRRRETRKRKRRVVAIVGRVHEEERLGKVLTSRHMKGLI